MVSAMTKKVNDIRFQQKENKIKKHDRTTEWNMHFKGINDKEKRLVNQFRKIIENPNIGLSTKKNDSNLYMNIHSRLTPKEEKVVDRINNMLGYMNVFMKGNDLFLVK